MNKFAFIRTGSRCVADTNRSGLSLIEVVVMASVTSMMLVMVTSWIHQTMKQSARFRTERREQLAVSQLSQHFRKHVWLANGVELDDSNVVSFQSPSGDRFTYRFKNQQIHFQHADASGETQALERFVLPVMSKVTFNRISGSRVALKIESLTGTEMPESRDQNWRTYQIIRPTLARWCPESVSVPLDSSDQPAADNKEFVE